jgi:hypothetical protein
MCGLVTIAKYFNKIVMMPAVMELPCVDIRQICGNKKILLPYRPSCPKVFGNDKEKDIGCCAYL